MFKNANTDDTNKHKAAKSYLTSSSTSYLAGSLYSSLSKSRKLLQSLVLLSSIFMITACVTQADKTILKVSSTKDIPDINKRYEKQLAQLKVGMTKSQVIGLFPGMERECFESGVCYFTVFDERFVQIDHRVADLNLLTTSLVTLLGLTCILSTDDCNEAIVAAINVAIASAVKNKQIHTTSEGGRVLTLLQWINIEFVDNSVTQWAVNEPLPQFIPKSFENKLPNLEDALK
jgi:hypothetical protein